MMLSLNQTPRHFVALCLLVWAPVGLGAGTTADGVSYLEQNKFMPGVVQLASGLQYKVLRAGSGEAHPLVGTPCECHYEGTLIDGTKFDSSYDRGSPTTFAPNQVIKGWTEAMQLMVEGDKWELTLPSELAYGDRGSPPKIPGGAVLKFIIEIVKIKGDTRPAERCDPETMVKCDDREKNYVLKTRAKEMVRPGHTTTELDRLKKMETGDLKEEHLSWLNARKAILAKMATTVQAVEINDNNNNNNPEL